MDPRFILEMISSCVGGYSFKYNDGNSPMSVYGVQIINLSILEILI